MHDIITNKLLQLFCYSLLSDPRGTLFFSVSTFACSKIHTTPKSVGKLTNQNHFIIFGKAGYFYFFLNLSKAVATADV